MYIASKLMSFKRRKYYIFLFVLKDIYLERKDKDEFLRA